jgi:hypothetical protein
MKLFSTIQLPLQIINNFKLKGANLTMENNELQQIDNQKEQYAKQLNESFDLLVPEGWDQAKIKQEFINKQLEKKFADTTSNNEINMRQGVATSNESELREIAEQTSGNEIATSNTDSVASKFGVTYETAANYEPHQYANIYPDSTQAEFESLVEDMRVHGQYEPAIIFEGKIADGRTRQKAQRELKRPMLAYEWLGTPEELLNYLHAKSQHRNLTSQQRAIVSLQFLEAEKELAKHRQGMRTDLQQIVTAIKGRASEITAKRHGTNRTYLGYAETIQNKAEELLEFVKKNEIPIGQAKLLAEKIDSPEQRLKAVEIYI